MSFRRRMILLAAGAVAAAIVIASIVVYVVTRNELRGQIDAQPAPEVDSRLAAGRPDQDRESQRGRAREAEARRQATARGIAEDQLRRDGGGKEPLRRAELGAQRRGRFRPRKRREESPPGNRVSIEGNAAFAQSAPAAKAPQPGEHVRVSPFNKLVLPAPRLGGAAGYVQLFQSNGQLLRSETKGSGGEGGLPITPATRAVAAGRRKAFFSDATVGGTPVRILTERAPEGGVWQVALPLSDVDSTLTHLKLVLALVCLGGIALAAALGLLVSRAALVPVRRLTGAAERVARTQDSATASRPARRTSSGVWPGASTRCWPRSSALASRSASSSPTPRMSCARR